MEQVRERATQSLRSLGVFSGEELTQVLGSASTAALEVIAGQEPALLKNRNFLGWLKRTYGLRVVGCCFQGYKKEYGNVALAIVEEGTYLADKTRMDLAAHMGDLPFNSP